MQLQDLALDNTDSDGDSDDSESEDEELDDEIDMRKIRLIRRKAFFEQLKMSDKAASYYTGEESLSAVIEHFDMLDTSGYLSSPLVFGLKRPTKQSLSPKEAFIIGLVLFKRFRGAGTFKGGCGWVSTLFKG